MIDTSDHRRSDAWLDGWFAHKNGDNPFDTIDNPYCARGQERSFQQWNEGWVARYSAIKHDLPLEVDED